MKFNDVFGNLKDKVIELKLKSKYLGAKEITTLARQLSSDSKRMELIYYYRESSNSKGRINYVIGRIAAQLVDDENKMKLIEDFKDISEIVVTIGPSLNSETNLLKVLSICVDLGYDKRWYLGDIIDKIRFFDTIDETDSKVMVFVNLYKKNKNIEEIKRKLEEVKELKTKDDDEKIRRLGSFDDEFLKSEIINTFSNEELKIQYLKELKNSICKYNVIKTLSDDKKIELFELIDNDWQRTLILSTLSDEYKYKVLERLKDDNVKTDIIETIEDIEIKLKAIEKIKSWNYKKFIIKKLDIATRINFYMKEGNLFDIRILLSNEKEIIKRMSDNPTKDKEKFKELRIFVEDVNKITKSKNDDEKIEFVKNIENINIKIDIINSIRDDEKKIECLKEIGQKEFIRIFRTRCEDIDFLKNNIKTFAQLEGFEDEYIFEILEELFKDNNDIVRTINFEFIKPEYIELLGMDKINLIGCYPEIQESFIEIEDIQKKIFYKCIDEYVKKTGDEEWTDLANEILKNLSTNEYDLLLNNLEDINKLSKEDWLMLAKVLQGENLFKIDSIEQVRNFEEIRRKKCEEIMQDDFYFIEEKRNATIKKLFGIDMEAAEELIIKYGHDIDYIEDNEIKYFIKALKEIMKVEDPSVLKEIFDNCEYVDMDRITIERYLKKEYAKLYNEGLYIPKKDDSVDGQVNVFEAGVDFKMIITSVGAFISHNKKTNYKDDWNRPSIGYQHFCTSYIRNDMIGTAPINSICYGFIEMGDDSLLLSNSKDVYSQKGLVSKGSGSRFYHPDTQIDRTVDYNEMDYKRIQNGKRKQPDYIVVFRENEKIDNWNEALKAQKQWNIPIVIVDKDKCLESERKKVKEMISEYDKNPSKELAKEIVLKVRNNRVTNYKFCEEIDEIITKIEIENEAEPIIDEGLVFIEYLKENYKEVDAVEREKVMGKIEKMYREIIEKKEDNTNARKTDKSEERS